MSNVRNIDQSKLQRITEVVFILWGLTLPFAAKIGHFSLGFLTIYPNLIFGLLLAPLVLLTFPKWNRYAKAYVIFLALWVAYAFIQPKLVGSGYHENWKFDLRSLGMQCLFAILLIGSYYTLDASLFFKRLRQGSAYLLIVVLSVGLLEFYTGYHLQGQFTDHLFREHTITNIFYTPLFIYDNANDYMVYLIMLSLLYFSLNFKEKEGSMWQVVTLMTICFLFAFNASSRIAMWLILGILGLALIKGFWQKITATWRVWILPTVLGLIFFTIALFSNPLFVGPKYTQHNFLTTGEYVRLPKSLPSEGMSSDNIRMALLKNGLDFIKEQPILGIGPGEFRERHARNLVQHDAWTVHGPHNFPLELVSQYGIIGWIYGLIWFALMVFLWGQFRKGRINVWALCLIPALAFCSIMPSGFLYLDIHWLLVPVLLILILQTPRVSTETDE